MSLWFDSTKRPQFLTSRFKRLFYCLETKNEKRRRFLFSFNRTLCCSAFSQHLILRQTRDWVMHLTAHAATATSAKLSLTFLFFDLDNGKIKPSTNISLSHVDPKFDPIINTHWRRFFYNGNDQDLKVCAYGGVVGFRPRVRKEYFKYTSVPSSATKGSWQKLIY